MNKRFRRFLFSLILVCCFSSQSTAIDKLAIGEAKKGDLIDDDVSWTSHSELGDDPKVDPVPTVVPTPRLKNKCEGVVCQECSEVCYEGRCVSSGRVRCSQSGACVDSGDECRCSSVCQPCVESCRANQGGSGYSCQASGKVVCPKSGECEDSGYCREGCGAQDGMGGVDCKACIERCEDGENGKVCVPSGYIVCKDTGACVGEISLLHCETPSCKPKCSFCTSVCNWDIHTRSNKCVSSGNILCPDGRCRQSGGRCGPGTVVIRPPAQPNGSEKW